MAELEKLLEDAFIGELKAVRQYTCHAALQDATGYSKLSGHSKEEAREELGHAEALASRMAFLGIPVPSNSFIPANVGDSPAKQISNDLSLELDAAKKYKDLISAAISARDYGTAEMAIKILLDEERHIAWLNAQMKLMEQVGESGWLQMLI